MKSILTALNTPYLALVTLAAFIGLAACAQNNAPQHKVEYTLCARQIMAIWNITPQEVDEPINLWGRP